MVTFFKAFISQPDDGSAVDRNVQLWCNDMTGCVRRKACVLIYMVFAFLWRYDNAVCGTCYVFSTIE
jgi:hypothetical protein